MTAALTPEAEAAIESLAMLLETDPRAPISAGSIPRTREVHIADSLSGLEFAELRSAARIADLGAGAGLPGLVIAAALPAARVDLIEAARKKCDFIEAAIARIGLANAGVVAERAEDWGRSPEPGGREAYAAVTARAFGRLAAIAELASPLLEVGGVLLAWKGRRDPDEEAELARAADRVAMEPVEVRPVTPYAGSRDRHIHLLRKNGPTPEGLPRRVGSAAKRPFGSE